MIPEVVIQVRKRRERQKKDVSPRTISLQQLERDSLSPLPSIEELLLGMPDIVIEINYLCLFYSLLSE